MATSNLGYLDPRQWDDAGTVEGGPWIATELRRGDAVLRARAAARGGVLYWVPGVGIRSADRYDVEGFLRAGAEASVRVAAPLGTSFGARLYAGGYLGRSAPPRQRRITIAGADPYETFTNPLLRSGGALLGRPDFHYHAPGGAGLRGFAPHLGGRWALSANLELTKSVVRRERGLVREVALGGFVDGGVVDTLAVPAAAFGERYATLYDGGVALVTRQTSGDREWTLRLELPLVVSRPARAADAAPGDGRLAFRWQVSLEASF
jgi:hypothetical protein